METSAHYTRVGIFVIVFVVALIIGGLWLTASLTGKSYKNYLVYMHESVSGLSQKAPVKYNGVQIGYVDDISLYPRDPKQVRLLLAIEDDVPIYNGTKAVLETQGLTGIAFIELKGGDINRGLLKIKEGGRYPEIGSAPSLLFRLDAALDNLTTNIKQISASLKEVVNPQNAKAIQTTLNNFSLISTNLNHNTVKLNNIIDNAQITLQNTADASQKLPGVIKNIQQGAQSLNDMSAQLASSANKVDILVTNGDSTIQMVNNQLLPQLINSLSDVQSILDNTKTVSEKLAANPSVIIRGTVAPSPGPGE